MNQTSNYGLNQWEEQDRILREDFNEGLKEIEQMDKLWNSQTMKIKKVYIFPQFKKK